MEKDPVCGLDVDTKTTTLKSTYQGKTYYFCSPGCKQDFDKDPQKYTTHNMGGAEHKSQHMHSG